MKKSLQFEVGGIPLIIETGRWAKQSNGSAVVQYGDNVVMATANMKDEGKGDQDFFPLMVDFRINNYSAGKIPGGYFKREGKPSEREVLLSRLIDRPIRPLFPDNFYNETQIITNLLSADLDTDFDSMGIIAASVALLTSTIPFNTPVGAVKLGLKDGEYIINPGLKKLKDMDVVVQVAGTEKEVVMIEAGGNEFSEAQFKDMLAYGKSIIHDICVAQKEFINPEKMVVEPNLELKELVGKLLEQFGDRYRDAIYTVKKMERAEQIKTLTKEIIGDETDDAKLWLLKKAIHELEYTVFRRALISEKKRNDGRAFDQVRDISIELGVLPRVHGSAVFTRGETQALATITLGSEDDAQRLDDLAPSGENKRFMLHYNFPPFSVGEVSFLRGTGRREVGHGNLAEKALYQVMPEAKEFPYTVRVVSDILESNGSSSMATVCGGSLALMNAGVPLSAPVSGIAMGLVKEGDDFVVLTDIAGYEDHFGDMDFKVAGTRRGITAVQLDIKIDGLNDAIIDSTLEQARQARLHILDKMHEAICEPAKELSEYAPVITTIQINREKIKDLIGPGGKTIKELVATFDVKINTEDDGKVSIAAATHDLAQQVIERIREITQGVEIGKLYTGKISRIEEYGVFVELFRGATGLVHISELSDQRVRNISDLNLNIGDSMEVRVIDVDRDNRIRVSRRAVSDEGFRPPAPRPRPQRRG